MWRCKFLEESRGNELFDIDLDKKKFSWIWSQNIGLRKGKMYHQTQRLQHRKELISNMKRWAMTWKKIFANMFDDRLYPKCIRNTVVKKPNNLTKNGQRIWIVTFSDKMANRRLKCCFTSQTRTLAKLQHCAKPHSLTPTPPPLVGLTVPRSQKFWWGSQGIGSLIFQWECKLLWLLWKTI